MVAMMTEIAVIDFASEVGLMNGRLCELRYHFSPVELLNFGEWRIGLSIVSLVTRNDALRDDDFFDPDDA